MNTSLPPDIFKAGKTATVGKRLRWIAGALTALALVVFMLLPSGGTPAGQYLTEEAAIGKLLVTISASGTLQPTKSVDVGSELSGTLTKVLVKENDRVTKGQLLARTRYRRSSRTRSPSRARPWPQMEATVARGARPTSIACATSPNSPAARCRRRPNWKRPRRRCSAPTPTKPAPAPTLEDRRNQSRQGDHPFADQRRGADAQGGAGADGGRRR